MPNPDPQLIVPDQSDIRDPTVETSPKKLKEWMEDLPFGDISSTTKMVYNALVGLNRTKIAAKTRFELLELYWPTVEQIGRSLAKYYEGFQQPMPLANRKIAQSLRKLHGEYADGYKIAVLTHGVKNNTEWSRPNLVTTCLYRAMELLGRVQSITYLAYLPPIEKNWLEIHKLYQYARNRSVDRIAAPQPGQPSSMGTVEEKYKAVLLTELTDPLRLETDQIAELVHYLERHSEQAHFIDPDNLPESEREARQGLFAIRFDYDTGAAPYGDLTVSSPSQGLLLDAQALIATAAQHLQLLETQIEKDASVFAANESLLITLRCVINAIGNRPERRYERVKSKGRAQVAKGLGATTWVLNGRRPFNPSNKPEEEFIEINSDGQPGRDSATASYETDYWEKVDTSEGGLALLRTRSAKSRVKIGDLLALRDDTAKQATWSIGVVKRFRYQDDENLLVGVQHLSTQARLIAIRRVSGASRVSSYRQGLLLAPNRQTGAGSSILTQDGYYLPGATYEIDHAGKKTRIVSGSPLELSRSFDHFLFTQR